MLKFLEFKIWDMKFDVIYWKESITKIKISASKSSLPENFHAHGFLIRPAEHNLLKIYIYKLIIFKICTLIKSAEVPLKNQLLGICDEENVYFDFKNILLICL